MSRVAEGLPSPPAGDGASRHLVVFTPLEADGFKNIPYITHRTQAIQLPFGRSLVFASASPPPEGVFILSVLRAESIIFHLNSGSPKHILPTGPLPYTVTLAGKNSHTITTLKLDVSAWVAAGFASFSFILLSLSMISYGGIQEDEALFSIPFFSAIPREYKIRTSHHDIPLMVMSYVGALKTWIFWPLLHWFGSSVWSIRLPVVFTGAVTVFLFYCLTRNSGGPRPAVAAAFGALLLATDPIFLLTNTYDWGPVALEHILLVGGCYLLIRFAQKRSRTAHLACGFLCFGLALWNKALFVWALSGLAVATVSIFWRELKACLTPRNIGLAVASFFLGALPFVIFNLRASNATMAENAHLDFDNLPQKWLQLERAADGSSLFAFLVDEDSDLPMKPPPTWKGRLAQGVWRIFGEHRESQFFSVLGVILALGPLWWRSRAARFSLVFLVVAWSMMAVTKNAGGAAHHDILLWPFPILFAVSALSQIPWRWLAIPAASALVLMNLLVVNQYVLQFERDGAAQNFSDALFSLDRDLPEDQTVYVIDWGMHATTQLSHQGRLHLQSAQAALMNGDPGPDAAAQLRSMLSDPGAVWVDHVSSHEAFRGVGATLEKFASAAGYRRELLRTVTDSNGRAVFEIFRFRAPE